MAFPGLPGLGGFSPTKLAEKGAISDGADPYSGKIGSKYTIIISGNVGVGKSSLIEKIVCDGKYPHKSGQNYILNVIIDGHPTEIEFIETEDPSKPVAGNVYVLCVEPGTITESVDQWADFISSNATNGHHNSYLVTTKSDLDTNPLESHIIYEALARLNSHVFFAVHKDNEESMKILTDQLLSTKTPSTPTLHRLPGPNPPNLQQKPEPEPVKTVTSEPKVKSSPFTPVNKPGNSPAISPQVAVKVNSPVPVPQQEPMGPQLKASELVFDLFAMFAGQREKLESVRLEYDEWEANLNAADVELNAIEHQIEQVCKPGSSSLQASFSHLESEFDKLESRVIAIENAAEGTRVLEPGKKQKTQEMITVLTRLEDTIKDLESVQSSSLVSTDQRQRKEIGELKTNADSFFATPIK